MGGVEACGKLGSSNLPFDSALRLNLHFHTLWPDGVSDPAEILAEHWRATNRAFRALAADDLTAWLRGMRVR